MFKLRAVSLHDTPRESTLKSSTNNILKNISFLLFFREDFRPGTLFANFKFFGLRVFGVIMQLIWCAVDTWKLLRIFCSRAHLWSGVWGGWFPFLKLVGSNGAHDWNQKYFEGKRGLWTLYTKLPWFEILEKQIEATWSVKAQLWSSVPLLFLLRRAIINDFPSYLGTQIGYREKTNAMGKTRKTIIWLILYIYRGLSHPGKTLPQ